MTFTPSDSHLSIALVLTGSFGQFADPLDWIARQYGLDVKVDRAELMESLAARGGAGRAHATALGSDKQTRFSIKLFGRCQGQLVALCAMSFAPQRFSMKELEERSIDIVVLNGVTVLGVQATQGKTENSLEGVELPDPLIRLFPLNVFSRMYYQPKIDAINEGRRIKVADVGEAVLMTLLKPWLFLDVASSQRRGARLLLPF